MPPRLVPALVLIIVVLGSKIGAFKETPFRMLITAPFGTTRDRAPAEHVIRAPFRPPAACCPCRSWMAYTTGTYECEFRQLPRAITPLSPIRFKQITGSSFAPFNQCRELDLANSPFIDGPWRARFYQTSDLLLDCITLAQPITKGIDLHLTPLTQQRSADQVRTEMWRYVAIAAPALSGAVDRPTDWSGRAAQVRGRPPRATRGSNSAG
jgi:hypothetical protein